MKNTVNLNRYLTISILCVGQMAVGNGPDPEVIYETQLRSFKAAKISTAIVRLNGVTSEIGNVENAYIENLNKLIKIEQGLHDQERSGIKWTLTSTSTKKKISEMLSTEIALLNTVLNCSISLKPLFKFLNDNLNVPTNDISLFHRGLIDDDSKVISSEPYEEYIKSLNKIAGVLGDETIVSAYLGLLKDMESNYAFYQLHHIMENKNGNPIKDILDLRARAFQRLMRYGSQFEEYTNQLTKLVSLLPNGPIKKEVDKVLAAARAVHHAAKAAAGRVNEVKKTIEIADKIAKKLLLTPDEVAFQITKGLPLPLKDQELFEKMRKGGPYSSSKEKERAEEIRAALPLPPPPPRKK